MDGDRFSTAASSATGKESRATRAGGGKSSSPRFATSEPSFRSLAITNLPCATRRKRYVWQASLDGLRWDDLEETATDDERRIFRFHRLSHSRKARWMRLAIATAEGEAPALREVEFYGDPHAEIAFPPWAVVVSTTGSSKVPGEGGAAFRRLARSCRGLGPAPSSRTSGWAISQSDFIAAEPRPLCAFLSGNFIDWCQQKREQWRGTADILQAAACRCGPRAEEHRGWPSSPRPGSTALGLPPVPRPGASPAADLHAHRRLGQAQVRRLLRLRLRARTVHDPSAFARSGLPGSSRRVPGDGKPLRSDRMGPRGAGS